jgi:hypothetical protein
MVARRFDTGTAFGVVEELLTELFEEWRRLLTRLRDALVRLGARFSPAEPPGAVPRPWLQRPVVVVLGDAALVLGVGVGIALAPPGSARYLAAWAGAQSVLWAAVRWLLMRYAGRGAAEDRSALLGASSLGLIAYALAVTPELRALAWAASAALTWFALVRLGDRRAEAGRTVAIAWGAQALVVTVSWIARNGVLAFLISRG